MDDFPTIPLLSDRPYDRIHEFYLSQEPMLIAAMKRGDRGEARHIINRVLVHIYSAGQERSDLLKALLLEMVVMISRAAVEAGAGQSEVLGLGFSLIAELAGIHDDEALAAWLGMALEHLFAVMEKQSSSKPDLFVNRALELMRISLHQNIGRDEVARGLGVSPCHFSLRIKQYTGWSFTELMQRLRVDHAADLLCSTEDSIAKIADACGFCDQSYFTRVFQEIRGVTPRQFRLAGKESKVNYSERLLDAVENIRNELRTPANILAHT
jgi:AraC-like DNA-binding protein